MTISFLKKKNVILGTLVGILLVASFVNFNWYEKYSPVSENDNPLNAKLVSSLSEDEVMSGAVSVDSEFFVNYRLEREATRAESLQTLQSITTGTDADSSSEAKTAMVELVKQTERELLLENMVKSKGFSDCVVFLHSGYVNVLVEGESINSAQAVQIQDIVSRECGVELSRISVAASGKAQEK